MNIGEKIKNLREDLDLSQAEVAKKIHMNQSGYSKIERGVQEPNLSQFRSLCLVLNVSPSYLLSLKIKDTSEEDIKFAKAVKEAYKRIYK